MLLLKIKSFSQDKKFISCQEEFKNVQKLINLCLKPYIKNIIPRKIYDILNELSTVNKITTELSKFRGIYGYGFFCKIDNKLYLGSSENLVNRFKEHIKGQKSNIKLQRAISK
jgi:hypothetical protein